MLRNVLVTSRSGGLTLIRPWQDNFSAEDLRSDSTRMAAGFQHHAGLMLPSLAWEKAIKVLKLENTER